MCPIIVTEFLSGITPHERRRWDAFFDTPTFASLTYEISVRAGEYRFAFARRGIAILTPDAVIAAVAKNLATVLVTNNAKDFPMTDIDILVP